MLTVISRSCRIQVLLLAVLAVALLSAAAQGATTANVSITNDRFTDSVSGNSTTTINAGDSVMWTWNAGTHSTTSGSCSSGCTPNGTWDSGIKSSGNFTQAFPTAGSFSYYCRVHGSMMQGTIVVQAGGAPPTANFMFQPAAPTIGTNVTFTDTSGGSPTSWAWNFGDPASGTSNTSSAQNPTHAFLSAGTYTVSLTATNAAGSNTATKSITASNGGSVPCVVSDTQLCLNNGRFAVTAAWEKPDGSSGNGHGVGLTGDSGYFWFFDSANIEAVVKVLNGCAITNAYWVFAAGLTNVAVHVTVTDNQTGAVYTRDNAQGSAFQPIQDTKAFPTSCP
jgi:PKD repeat protein